jgi:hypothetical protein
MGTQLFRLVFMLLFCSIILANDDREKIFLRTLLTHSSYPSIHYALQQIQSSQMDIQLELNSTGDAIPVCHFKSE